LLLLEHLPVYTLGRTTQDKHWDCGEEALRRTGADIHFVDRGGSITYHGPGQVVGYPILKLSQFCSGPKQYVRMLEEVLIHTVLRWGIEAYRLEKKPGVWVRWNGSDAKIGAIGVRVEAEDLRTGEVRNTASAYLTFVSLDEEGRPREVSPLILETEDDRRRCEAGHRRREERARIRELLNQKGLLKPRPLA